MRTKMWFTASAIQLFPALAVLPQNLRSNWAARDIDRDRDRVFTDASDLDFGLDQAGFVFVD